MKEKEHQSIEWKESWQDEYLKWICGYANAYGGTIYIGGEEDLRRLGKPVRCMMDHCRNTRLMRLELWFFARLVISIWGC